MEKNKLSAGLTAGKNKLIGLGALFVIMVVFPFVPVISANPYIIHMVIMILFYAYCTSGWNIVSGFAGQLSFGHAAYIAIGAYASVLFFTYLNLTPWIGMIIGGLIAMVLAVFVGIPAFRLRGAYYAISTIAFSEGFRMILETVTYVGPVNFGGAEGLMVKSVGNSFYAFQFDSKVPYYFIILGFTILAIVVSTFIEKSKFGYYMAAIKEDQEAAFALGINVQRIKLIAVAISAFMVALGGAFYVQFIRYVEPVFIAGNPLSDMLVFFAIVGGIGTVWGPIFGAAVLTLVGELSRTYFTAYPGLHLVVYGTVVIIVIMFSPQGMFLPLRDMVLKFFAGMKQKKAVGG